MAGTTTSAPPTNPTDTAQPIRVLQHALDQAGEVLDHVHADDLGQRTPCPDWDVAALADHLIATPSNFVTMMRGDQPDWSAPAPHVDEGRGQAFRAGADDLMHAWHGVDRADGDLGPAAWQVAEVAVHTWDLAVAIGWPLDRLDPEVAETALGYLRDSLKPEMRDPVFGPEQTAPADAGPYDQLAAFAGRPV